MSLIGMIIGIPLVIGCVCAIIINAQFLSGKANKVAAGVLGLLFSGILGGILVLVSERVTH